MSVTVDLSKEITPGKQLNNLFPQWLEAEKTRYFVPSGLAAIDNITGGFAGLVVVGGGPGTGKTAFTIQAAEKYALQGGPVFYLAYEQGAAGVFSRLLQRITGISPKDHRGELSKPETVERLQNHINQLTNFWVHSLPGVNETPDFVQLEKNIEEAQQATGKAALVVVDSLHYTPLPDHLQVLDGKRAIDESLKTFSKIQQQTSAVVLAICHQTKSEADQSKTGIMSFSGSAMIAYAADMAIQIKREEYQQDTQAAAVFYVVKNRFGMVENTEAVLYDLENQTFKSHDTINF